jgi:sucrose phosphorylase
VADRAVEQSGTHTEILITSFGKTISTMSEIREKIRELLASLYGLEQADGLLNSLWQRIEDFNREHPNIPLEPLNEKDMILITYGDQFQEQGYPTLQTLNHFLQTNLQDVISGIHILPFYPYSSDDGFSVIDYRQVSQEFGTWQDISHLGENFQLMFDLVVNHISAKSIWFQNFLKGRNPYRDYFLVLDKDTDLSWVVRPRSTPILTPFQTSDGLRHVWTTFSTDQIDLDYSNPLVLLEMIDVLLFYISSGARIIRLDAIAYLWKLPGTSCINLEQTHVVVKLFRSVLDATAPSALLITETNVPHQENVSYFGNFLPEAQRTDEAQLVYQFPLAPLVLHTFLNGDSTRLRDWASGLPAPTPGTTTFNFTASHDGIGLRPAEGLLHPDEIQALVTNTIEHGGQVSYRSNSDDGSQSPYELNITWYDALNDPSNPDAELDIPRFLASQAIMLSLAGVPGIYVHSLFGSRNCISCLEKTGRARSINREKFLMEELEMELSDPYSLKSRVLIGYFHLLYIRKQQPVFHPAAQQRVLDLGSNVFATLRSAENETKLICVTNVNSKPLQKEIKLADFGLPENSKWIDQLTGKTFSALQILRIDLSPYQCLWLSNYPKNRTG